MIGSGGSSRVARYPWRAMVLALVLSVGMGAGIAQGALIITEIMYDPAGGNEHEYVELFNTGPTAVDLTGYVLEDSGGNQATLSGSIASGEVAVLIRIDTSRLHSNYVSAWDPTAPAESINWIDVSPWPNFTNSGDSVILRDPSQAIIAQVDYSSGSDGWPTASDAASIYLLNPNGPQNDPANWALSQNGVDGAHLGLSPRASDVGSPGFVVIPEPASFLLACTGLLALGRRPCGA